MSTVNSDKVKIGMGGQAGGYVPTVDVSAVESKVEREFKARYEAGKELSGRAARVAHGKRVTVAVTEGGVEIEMAGIEYDGALYDIHGTPLPGNYYKKKPALGLAILCISGLITAIIIISIFRSGSW